MPRHKPPDPPAIRSKKGAVQDAEARTYFTKKTTGKKSPNKVIRPTSNRTRRTKDSSKTAELDTVNYGADPTPFTRPMEKAAMDPKMTMQVPDAVRELAEKTVDQAEKAFEAFMSAANKSIAMVPNPATEISKKTLTITEQNMKTSFDHARKLIHAKDVQEVMQIQAEFLKNQFAAAGEQMKELTTGVISAAKDAHDNNKHGGT
jgi:phasin